MTNRAAYQLVGLGAAIMGVGLLNIAANSFDAARFRTQIADAARRTPERFTQLRNQLQTEEGINDAGADGGSSPLD